MARDGYTSLRKILKQAEKRASEGKGKERHAVKGVPFEHQPICTEAREMGIAPNIYQIRKKSLEANRFVQRAITGTMSCNVQKWTKQARDELFDIIIYAAATVLVLAEELTEDAQKNS